MANTPPVCHIPPVPPRTQPHPINLPAIPPVTNPSLQVLANAVNAIRTVVMYLSGQQPTQGGGRIESPKNKEPKPTRWIEASRRTEDVTITDPNSGASITFTRINQLTMHDHITGEAWTWNRERTNSGR